MTTATEPTVTVPLWVARLVCIAFLPRNPNKLRRATPEVKEAAGQFVKLVNEASRKAASAGGPHA
jgi:hypothetical protein